MLLAQVEEMIRAAGGGDNALAYAEALREKVSRIEGLRQFAPLLAQLCASREQGDFRGRVLEVNFADCFARQGIALDYGIRQGMSGDIDFGWKVEGYLVNIESKLLGQDKATRDRINAQLDDSGMSAIFVDDDTKDVARLQADIIQKASTRKFNPKPDRGTVNLVAIDVTELQLGTVDICDCLLAAGGNTLTAQHCNANCLREPVVGAFEDISPANLRESQRSWLATVQNLKDDVPHPRTYLHGALFLFREPAERAALSYELRGAVVWNQALIAPDVAKKICGALHSVIPQAK
nr:hypothetical protein [uncultured Ralstonia sp.]